MLGLDPSEAWKLRFWNTSSNCAPGPGGYPLCFGTPKLHSLENRKGIGFIKNLRKSLWFWNHLKLTYPPRFINFEHSFFFRNVNKQKVGIGDNSQKKRGNTRRDRTEKPSYFGIFFIAFISAELESLLIMRYTKVHRVFEIFFPYS